MPKLKYTIRWQFVQRRPYERIAHAFVKAGTVKGLALYRSLCKDVEQRGQFLTFRPPTEYRCPQCDWREQRRYRRAVPLPASHNSTVMLEKHEDWIQKQRALVNL